MRVAFYAPLKAPDHPSASGDRRMARAFMELLRGLGHDVLLACHLRSYDRNGNAERQQRLVAIGATAAALLCKRWRHDARRRPDLWMTYHAYHKAPDHLGPAVSRELRIPYVVAEASSAGKQAGGLWAAGHRATLEGLSGAAAVLAMTRVDLAGLRPRVAEHRLHLFPPFLDAAEFSTMPRDAARVALARDLGIDPASPWLLAVAMMRDDVKKQSYLLLAETLESLGTRDWVMLIVGDGVARREIEARMAPLGARVVFLGHRPTAQLLSLYAAADLMLWPALREAYGMALLEAQAAGLPVVACREGGVADVVEDGVTGVLVDGRSPALLAQAADRILADTNRRLDMSRAARARALAVHDSAIAAVRLETILRESCACA